MKLRIQDLDRVIDAPAGANLLEVLRENGLHPDAPCGGKGKCGKCKVLVDGVEQLACQTSVDRDLSLVLPHLDSAQILTDARTASVKPDGANHYCIAFDLGTTTVVAYLMDGITGALLSKTSCMNPQAQFGADVISRIEYAMEGHAAELSGCIRQALGELTESAAKQAGISPTDITAASIVGNTAMHHLLLEIDPKPLTVPPYMPNVSEALTLSPAGLLPINPGGTVRILPNIAGFVGADTVGCLLATKLDTLEDLTLMIDIGTNGEMVLGSKNRRIACSTAAGPAFEGAKIECGMRGAPGAVDHVTVEDGKLRFHVIGEGEAVGLCGSGLLDLIAALLETEEISESISFSSSKILPFSCKKRVARFLFCSPSCTKITKSSEKDPTVANACILSSLYSVIIFFAFFNSCFKLSAISYLSSELYSPKRPLAPASKLCIKTRYFFSIY